MANLDWYRGLADIRGLGYIAPADIDRTRLHDKDAEPEVRTEVDPDTVTSLLGDWVSDPSSQPELEESYRRGELDPGLLRTKSPGALGEGRTYLWWGKEGGLGSTSSPAQEHAVHALPSLHEAAADVLLRNLYESLELPGTATDYHFALLSVYEELWRRRKTEPQVLEVLERLCLLDVRLIEELPTTIRSEFDEDQKPYGVPAFDHLVTMYEREGALQDALAIAEKADRFEQGLSSVPNLRRRLAAIEAEDEPGSA